MYRKSQCVSTDAVIDFMFHEYNKVIDDDMAMELSELFTKVIHAFNQNSLLSNIQLPQTTTPETPWMTLIGSMGLVSRFFHFQFQSLALVDDTSCPF